MNSRKEILREQHYSELARINERHIQELSLIRRLSEATQFERPFEHAAQELLQIIVTDLKATAGFLHLAQKTGELNLQSIATAAGVRLDAANAIQTNNLQSARNAISEGRSVVARGFTAGRTENSMMLSTPLHTRDQLLGVIEVYFDSFDDEREEIPVVPVAANLVALLLDNIRNYEALHEKTVALEQRLQERKPPSTASEKQAEGIRILVIDDSPQVLDIIKSMLNRKGHEVVALAHGKDAFGLDDLSSFELVITDLEMPEINGYQVAQAVKMSNPDTPVILMTGASAALDQEYLYSVGVDHFLNKPFGGRVLDKAIKYVREGSAL